MNHNSQHPHAPHALVLKPVLGTLLLLIGLLLAACSSVNCPLESTVRCNYYFYDEQGAAYTLPNTLTVTTLLAGNKLQYTYQKLGETTYVLDARDSTLLAAGYVESVREVRRDTVLINKLSSAQTMSVPVSYFNACDTLIFAYSNITAKDTLYVEHDSYTHVDQPECGTSRFARLKQLRATDAAINQVEVVRADVNYDGLENVKIYFNAFTE